jgi:hypothetical protein
MDELYRRRKIDAFVQRIMALGYRFDDDGSIDVFLFGQDDHHYGELTVDTYRDFTRDMLGSYELESATYYGKVMARVRRFYRAQPDWGRVPVHVMFVTDGGTGDKRRSETEIIEASREPLFWQFVAIGETRRRGQESRRRVMPSGFDYLDYLDRMEGRFIDNASFFAVADPTEPTDEELFELLMEEYLRWLEQAVAKGVVHL